jgi:putative inorganic carbon (HCO3(-)) transporter
VTPRAIGEWLTSPRSDAVRLAALAPFLMFPTVMPAVTAAAAIGWLALLVIGRYRGAALWPPTPLDGPLLVVGLMAIVGAVVSTAPDLMLPKAAGLALGFAAYRSVLVSVRSSDDAWRAAALVTALGCALILQGAVTTAWFDKVTWLAPITHRIPRLVRSLPGTYAEGVHPNALGGTILLVLPAIATLLLRRRAWPQAWARFGPITAVIATILAVLLVLTQSRTSWAAFVLTMLVIASLLWRPVRRVLVTAAVIGAVSVPLWRQPALAYLLRLMPDAGSAASQISWAGRQEVWQRAMTAIGDAPITGVGLNAFRRVVHEHYPLAVAPEQDFAHAHNVFLQTALDIGLPGLAGYLVLLVAVTWMAWEMWRRSAHGILALAIWSNVLAVHLFGFGDALVLGNKVGLLFWLDIGLIVVLRRHCTVESLQATA